MANRLVGNTYILDTSSGNTPIPWPAGAKVSTIAFWSSDSTGMVRFCNGNTTNTLLELSNPNNAPATVGAYLGRHYFTDTLTVPQLVAGTAWIYLV